MARSQPPPSSRAPGAHVWGLRGPWSGRLGPERFPGSSRRRLGVAVTAADRWGRGRSPTRSCSLPAARFPEPGDTGLIGCGTGLCVSVTTCRLQQGSVQAPQASAWRKCRPRPVGLPACLSPGRAGSPLPSHAHTCPWAAACPQGHSHLPASPEGQSHGANVRPRPALGQSQCPWSTRCRSEVGVLRLTSWGAGESSYVAEGE